jgi:hypothetical protein
LQVVGVGNIQQGFYGAVEIDKHVEKGKGDPVVDHKVARRKTELARRIDEEIGNPKDNEE